MSQENVEATKRANAALNRGDVDASLELFAPDAVLEDRQNAPDQPVTVEGVQAIRETLLLWAAAFDRLHADIEEIDVPVGGLVLCRFAGLARELSGPVSGPVGMGSTGPRAR